MRKSLSHVLVIVMVMVMVSIIPAFGANVITVYIDGTKVIFDQPPINKDGRTLVPLRAIFEGLGMTVEWDQASQKIVASNDNVEINLQVGNVNASVGNDEAGFIETELDVAPQIVNGSTLVPVRFIGEASGSDVVWDGTTKSVNITSRPDRVFGGDRAFHTFDWGYKYTPTLNDIGYYIEGVNKEGQAKLDGFGKSVYMQVSWVGTFKNGKLNGHITYTMENGDKLIGDYNDGRLIDGNGKYVFSSGATYVGPIGNDSLPHGTGTYTDVNGNTAKVKYINGEYKGIVDPTKSYDFYGELLQKGDSVSFMTIIFYSVYGTVTDVNGGKVKVDWYDIKTGGRSILYTYESADVISRIQSLQGITFYTPQWMDADELFLKERSPANYPDAFQ